MTVWSERQHRAVACFWLLRAGRCRAPRKRPDAPSWSFQPEFRALNGDQRGNTMGIEHRVARLETVTKESAGAPLFVWEGSPIPSEAEAAGRQVIILRWLSDDEGQ